MTNKMCAAYCQNSIVDTLQKSNQKSVLTQKNHCIICKYCLKISLLQSIFSLFDHFSQYERFSEKGVSYYGSLIHFSVILFEVLSTCT